MLLLLMLLLLSMMLMRHHENVCRQRRAIGMHITYIEGADFAYATRRNANIETRNKAQKGFSTEIERRVYSLGHDVRALRCRSSPVKWPAVCMAAL
jgi:hypothetical protein